tara:strand:- start:1696 stop:1881 length:186 start_codon:yes stop_codon:yes gene_type:complete
MADTADLARQLKLKIAAQKALISQNDGFIKDIQSLNEQIINAALDEIKEESVSPDDLNSQV